MSARTDLELIAQLTLDLEDLQQYYHVDVFPERSPLIVVSPLLMRSGVSLQKFGRPIVYMEPDKAHASGLPYLEFTEISIDNAIAKVAFRYAVEGLRGAAEFQKVSGAWTVTSSRLLEH